MTRKLCLGLIGLLILACSTPKKDTYFLALGDSYTIGEGVTYDERWPVQLFNELKKSTDKIDSIKFIAKTGTTSSQLLAAIDNANLQSPFGLIVV